MVKRGNKNKGTLQKEEENNGKTVKDGETRGNRIPDRRANRVTKQKGRQKRGNRATKNTRILEKEGAKSD